MQIDLYLLDRSNLFLWPTFTAIVALLLALLVLLVVHGLRLKRWSLVTNPTSPASFGTILFVVASLVLLSGGGFLALCLSRPLVAADLQHVASIAGLAGIGGLVGALIGGFGGRSLSERAHIRNP